MRTLDIDNLILAKGLHQNSDDGLCLLEAAAYLAGEDHSDQPECVSPVLRAFGQDINDRFDDVKRQKLKPMIPGLLGTAGDGLDEARGYLALDWLIRTYTPAWLDLAGLTEEAAELRGLRRIVDLAAAQSAGPLVRSGADKAREAWDAAGTAAWAIAGTAGGVAAWDATRAAGGAAGRAAARAATRAVAGAAARAATRAAGRAAAGAAARAATRAVAGAAARDALAPTVAILQDSAIDLFSRMVKPRG